MLLMAGTLSAKSLPKYNRRYGNTPFDSHSVDRRDTSHFGNNFRAGGNDDIGEFVNDLFGVGRSDGSGGNRFIGAGGYGKSWDDLHRDGTRFGSAPGFYGSGGYGRLWHGFDGVGYGPGGASNGFYGAGGFGGPVNNFYRAGYGFGSFNDAGRRPMPVFGNWFDDVAGMGRPNGWFDVDRSGSLGSAVSVGGVDASVVDVDGGRRVSAEADGDDVRAELEGAGLRSPAEADT